MTNIYCIRPRGFNIGNEAIQVALRHLLNRGFGEPVNVINLPATGRYESHSKAGLTPDTVHEMNQYGDGVIVGGGNLYENGELDVDLGALRSLAIPMMLFSLSMGRIYNRRGELVRRTDSMRDETIRALHHQADISIARDQATVRHLAAAGATTVLGGCPTLFMDEIPQHTSLEAEGVAEVLVSIRTPELMSVPLPRRIRVKDEIHNMVSVLREEHGYTVNLLCHDHRDIPAAASFGDVDYVYTDDVYAFLSLLRDAKLSISYRLHAVLPCLAFGTPVVKISYDERGNSTMETIGMGEWNIDMLTTRDVRAEVKDRLNRLTDFETHRVAARERWGTLRKVQWEAVGAFADLVRDHQQRNAVAASAITPSEA